MEEGDHQSSKSGHLRQRGRGVDFLKAPVWKRLAFCVLANLNLKIQIQFGQLSLANGTELNWIGQTSGLECGHLLWDRMELVDSTHEHLALHSTPLHWSGGRPLMVADTQAGPLSGRATVVSI